MDPTSSVDSLLILTILFQAALRHTAQWAWNYNLRTSMCQKNNPCAAGFMYPLSRAFGLPILLIGIHYLNLKLNVISLQRGLLWLHSYSYSISFWNTSYTFSNALLSFIASIIYRNLNDYLVNIPAHPPQAFKLSDWRDNICFICCSKVGTHHSACGRSLVNTCRRNENQSSHFDGPLFGCENGRILYLLVEQTISSEVMPNGRYPHSSIFG